MKAELSTSGGTEILRALSVTIEQCEAMTIIIPAQYS